MIILIYDHSKEINHSITRRMNKLIETKSSSLLVSYEEDTRDLEI